LSNKRKWTPPAKGDIYLLVGNGRHEPVKNYYLVLSTNKHYSYELLHLNTGQTLRMLKSELERWGFRITNENRE
jgi:hypothetical protein